MSQIQKVEQLTHNKFLNMYQVSGKNRKGGDVRYFVASRAKAQEQMKMKTRVVNPDGVIIYSIYGEQKDKVVLVRQYRYTIDDYIYEFPAGLVDPGETYQQAATREMKEETGLSFEPLQAPEGFEKPAFTSVGMSDEACATVFGYAKGEPDKSFLEDTEDLEIILADRIEVKRILKEEKTAIMTAYMLMHFLHDEEPFGFLD